MTPANGWVWHRCMTIAEPWSPSTADDAGRRLALLLESTGEGIFGIDMDGACTFVNRAAVDMLGWRTEEVLGRNMHELIHHSHGDGRHYPECDCPIFKGALACRPHALCRRVFELPDS